jgi:cell division protein FtsL
MSNLARELEQQKRLQNQAVQEPKKANTTKSWFTPGEKMLGILFAGMVCFGAVHMISTQAKIYKVNKDIQEVQTSIKDQQKVNSDLQVQVNELSTYERIWSKAKKMGLELNENNVKVVQGK